MRDISHGRRKLRVEEVGMLWRRDARLRHDKVTIRESVARESCGRVAVDPENAAGSLPQA